jgi:CHAT domain-containing protein
MEVDLVVTSACLTGQLDVDRPEEWLGLPLALQAVWKTKTLLLTLWEVDELAAMIWVVTLVNGLTGGLTAGEAQRRAQKQVKQTTYEQVENIWLSDAKKHLTVESWNNIYNRWKDFESVSGDYPFSDPVYWAPFVLIGDPTLTISPKRPL